MTTKAELVKAPTQEMVEAAPSFMKRGERTGMEHLTAEDIQMPRLAIAQSMSPEIDADDAKHIEGLSVGTLFNSLTQTIYGTGPLEFAVVRADPPIFIEFGPDGKTIVDRNVSPHDPRTQFGSNGEKPKAQKFYNFVVLLLPTREMIALSFKSTGLKAAKILNGLITSRGSYPVFAGKYSLSSVMTKNDKGKFGIYSIKISGWVDENTYIYAQTVFEGLTTKVITIDHDADTFDTDAIEATATGGM